MSTHEACARPSGGDRGGGLRGLAFAGALFALGLALDVVEDIHLHFLLRFAALGTFAAALVVSVAFARTAWRLVAPQSA